MRFAHLVIIAALSAPQIWAQDIIAFTGAKIIPIAGPEIASGVLKVEDARIVAVGPASSTQIPARARVESMPRENHYARTSRFT